MAIDQRSREAETNLWFGVHSSTVVHQVRRHFYLVLLGRDMQRCVAILCNTNPQ